MEQSRQASATDTANDSKPLVSVIVPVYKTPVEFLSRCIQSITDQTYPFLEILLIDDGSPAPYPEEYQRIAQNDTRISIIRRQNGGVSAARNDGLKRASGEWCLFVDADDWIEHTLCCDALNAAQKFYVQNGFQTDLIFFPTKKNMGNILKKSAILKMNLRQLQMKNVKNCVNR